MNVLPIIIFLSGSNGDTLHGDYEAQIQIDSKESHYISCVQINQDTDELVISFGGTIYLSMGKYPLCIG